MHHLGSIRNCRGSFSLLSLFSLPTISSRSHFGVVGGREEGASRTGVDPGRLGGGLANRQAGCKSNVVSFQGLQKWNVPNQPCSQESNPNPWYKTTMGDHEGEKRPGSKVLNGPDDRVDVPPIQVLKVKKDSCDPCALWARELWRSRLGTVEPSCRITRSSASPSWSHPRYFPSKRDHGAWIPCVEDKFIQFTRH